MTDMVAYETHGAVAVLRLQNPPVNALSQAVRQALMQGMDRAEADPGVRAVLIVGDGRAFIAGADIKEFGKPPREPHLPDLCDRIEASPLLVVASMHGVSLGGGLEVALSAHYRIAQPEARIGLPEVHLGLIPGAGGTQRLPRLTGAKAAVEVITSGRHVPADEAARLGIIDRVEAGDPQAVGLACAQALLASGAARRPVSEMPAPAPIDWDATYAKVLKKGRGQLSPAQAVRAVQASAELPFADGLAAERRIFQELMATDQRQGMIHAFFSERAVSNLSELASVAPRAVEAVGVIGGGTMGAGIATSALLAGLSVVLVERGQTAAEAARARIAGNLDGALNRGKLTQERHDALLGQALEVVTDYAALADVDLVIEAVFEDMAVKTAVFAELDAVCKPGAVLATNTSYLDIGEIAAQTSRPSDVIGLHFFSPAHVMKLLEVVVPDQTVPDVVATGFALGKRMGKVAVRSGVCDGFIGNRIMRAYRTAADHMVLDGATPFEIDAALTDFGFAMGPFAVSDLAGLDIAWAMRKRLAPTRDPRERVGRYPDTLCEAGEFGRKTGKGFYLYDAGSVEPNPEVMELVMAERAERGITPRGFSPEEIQRRYMAAMVNEAAKIVGEGIARRPLDVDMVLLFGYGFPRYHGGPLKWADLQGVDTVLADIETYAREDDFFWQPAPLLRQLAAEGRCFDDLNKAPQT
ncbi:3-hydroxyacyl-CoA dehydrogenase NAD-binding domain-containing protein [Roseobacter sinensis]|uniref:3-hydroxyacyl-CoA dehydrogenase NAD-binding domain-containing protein n=1 Tax=Roseobacter sinensis TaxID=2931391 RepID=A0ABT3BB70_9RHOB|nr:3-hydroxyacyl-CoA dehydrogenase NAD-binding domain-containing protein [Roseobacter sp. WL0113]MCV3270797.1 3-hydroxyacyl-CoA dehydrogenase NAD-binding domain-containing protein [Roseobacter sp. WL0113]